jgi:TPR repeat protein
MTHDEKPPVVTRGVRPEQIASILRDLGYRGLVDADGARVLSAAMGFDFRVIFYRPFVVGEETLYENYIFDMGSYLSPSAPISRLVTFCNELNAEYRFGRFYVGGNDGGRRFLVVQMDAFADGSTDDDLRRNCDLFISCAGMFRNLLTRIENDADNLSVDEHSRAVRLIQGSEDERTEAAELYYSAACQGFAGSQNNLGDLYERGLVVPMSPVIAAYWYARAAERGEPTAYLSLATLMFANAEDNWTLIEAMKFAFLAADCLTDGNRKAAALEIAAQLREKLPDGSIDLARRRATDWSPLFQETRLMSDPTTEGYPSDVLLN